MHNILGIVKVVIGQVFAIAVDGTQRELHEGDRIFAGEEIVTSANGALTVNLSDGHTMDMGRNSHWSDQSGVAAAANTEHATDDVAALQQAITDGVDPTKALDATAAGNEAPIEAGTGGGGHFIERVELTGEVVDATSGFPTAGLGSLVHDHNQFDTFISPANDSLSISDDLPLAEVVAHVVETPLTTPTPAEVPQTELTPAFVPQTELTPAFVPLTELTPAQVPLTNLTPAHVPLTDLTPAQVPLTELTPAQVPLTDLTPAHVPLTDLTPAQVPLTDLTPSHVPLTDLTPAQVPLTDLTPAHVPLTDLTPAQVPLTELTPAQVPLTDLTPAHVPLTDLTPAQVPLTNLTPAEVPLTDLTPSHVPLTDLTPAQVPLTELTPAQVPLTDLTPAHVPLTDLTPAQVPLTNLTPAQVPLTELTPAHVPLTDLTPAQVPLTELTPAQVPLTELTPAHVPLTDLTPAQVPLTDLTPAHVPLTDLTPAQVPLTELTPAQVPLTDLTPSHVPLTDLTPAQVPLTDLTPAHVPLTDLTPAQVPLTDLTPSHVPLTDLTPAQVPLTDLTPAQVPLTDLTPAQVPLTDLTPAHVPLTDLTPAQVPLTDLTPSHVPLTDLTPAQVPLTDLTPAHVPLTDLTPAQVPLTDLTPAHVPLTDLTSAQVPLTDLTPAQVPLTDLTPVHVPLTDLTPAQVPLTELKPAKHHDHVSITIDSIETEEVPSTDKPDSGVTHVNGGSESPDGFDVKDGKIVSIGSNVRIHLSENDNVPGCADPEHQILHYNDGNEKGDGNYSDIFVVHPGSQYRQGDGTYQDLHSVDGNTQPEQDGHKDYVFVQDGKDSDYQIGYGTNNNSQTNVNTQENVSVTGLDGMGHSLHLQGINHIEGVILGDGTVHTQNVGSTTVETDTPVQQPGEQHSVITGTVTGDVVLGDIVKLTVNGHHYKGEVVDLGNGKLGYHIGVESGDLKEGLPVHVSITVKGDDGHATHATADQTVSHDQVPPAPSTDHVSPAHPASSEQDSSATITDYIAHSDSTDSTPEAHPSPITQVNGGSGATEGFDIQDGKIIAIGSNVRVWLSDGDTAPHSADSANQITHYHDGNVNSDGKYADIYVVHDGSGYTNGNAHQGLNAINGMTQSVDSGHKGYIFLQDGSEADYKCSPGPNNNANSNVNTLENVSITGTHSDADQGLHLQGVNHIEGVIFGDGTLAFTANDSRTTVVHHDAPVPADIPSAAPPVPVDDVSVHAHVDAATVVEHHNQQAHPLNNLLESSDDLFLPAATAPADSATHLSDNSGLVTGKGEHAQDRINLSDLAHELEHGTDITSLIKGGEQPHTDSTVIDPKAHAAPVMVSESAGMDSLQHSSFDHLLHKPEHHY